MQQQFRETLEEVNIAYVASPLSQDHGGSSGPVAGQRALDAMLVRLSDRQTIHLFDALRVPQWSLLLFAGTRSNDETAKQLASLGQRVQEQYSRLVIPHLVVTTATPPASDIWNASVLMDREQFAHTTYGITGPCLYLVRPDWYIGFRAPLAGAEELLTYLQRIAL